MTSERDSTRPTSPLPATPALDRLIERVRARMGALVVIHGLGTAVIFTAGWLAFAFLADWILHVPAPVRVFHLAVLVGLPIFVLVRSLVRPLRARPDRAGVAVLVERAHPGHAELLVSAVELATSKAPSGDRGYVERVLRDADSAAGRLDPTIVLDARGPRRRALLGGAAAVLVLVLLFVNASAAGIFVARMAGGATEWPQRTRLTLEIPAATASAASVESALGGTTRDGELVVRVARGADVPVIVHAEGLIPDEVVLHFEGGHRSVLGSSGGPVFRTLLRSVQEDTTFHATGGDDQDDEPRARLVVLEPPDVTRIAVSIQPPTYSGLPARLETDPDVEVLRGSKLVVHVLTTPPNVTGKVRILPEDRVIDLVPLTFPSDGAAAEIPGLAFTFEAERSVRYRFEIVDTRGLSNPDPGLYGITVVEDRAPEVEVLAPGRGDFDTIAGGLLPLRIRAQDDFRVARVGFEVTAPGAELGSGTLRELVTRELTPEERSVSEPERVGAARSVVFAHDRIAIADLAAPAVEGASALAIEGQQFQIVVRAFDAAEPVAHEGRSSPLRVRVVQPEEFLRRIQDRLARAQSQATGLLALQREKQRLALEMLTALASDAPGIDDAQQDLALALTGARRVQGDARALARELAGSAESVLYARIDERATAALEAFDTASSNSVQRGFDPEPWRELARATRASDIAGSGLTAKLIDIATLSLEISEDHATAAVVELARAVDATDLPKVRTHLQAAEMSHSAVVERLERLLERLAEWDNFQSVLGLTRDILNGQKLLSERTRDNAKDK